MTMKQLIKTTAVLLPPLVGLVFSSCSDITRISGEQLTEHEVQIDGPGSKIITNQNPPLFVLNGTVISGEYVRCLKPAHVDSVAVLQGAAAAAAYGSDGQHGVVEIYAGPRILTDPKTDTTPEIENGTVPSRLCSAAYLNKLLK